jgi:hypothetical protein
MAILVIRILLLLAPVFLLILWLVKRSNRVTDNEGNDVDVIGARKILLVVLSLVTFVAAVLYFTEDDKGNPGQIYVPARVEDGKVNPGYFKNGKDSPVDSEPAENDGLDDNAEGSDKP